MIYTVLMIICSPSLPHCDVIPAGIRYMTLETVRENPRNAFPPPWHSTCGKLSYVAWVRDGVRTFACDLAERHTDQFIV
jgi:hypothetical protein